jgi:hypothetical protein
MCGEEINAYRVLVGKHKGKRSLRWPKPGCDNNIKVDVREINLEGRDWNCLGQEDL